jgi:hypothetical protein
VSSTGSWEQFWVPVGECRVWVCWPGVCHSKSWAKTEDHWPLMWLVSKLHSAGHMWYTKLRIVSEFFSSWKRIFATWKVCEIWIFTSVNKNLMHHTHICYFQIV